MNYDDYKKDQLSKLRISRFFPSGVDFFQIVPALLLVIVGIFFIYGIGQQIGSRAYLDMWKKQILWFSMGICFWFYFSFFFDYRSLKKWSLIIYPVCIFLLLAVFLGGAKINEARRWLPLGPVRIQPSEFAKTGIIIVNAMILSSSEFKLSRLTSLAGILLINAIPFFLIVIEPDLGAAMMIVPIAGAMLFAAGIGWKWIFAVFLALSLSLPAAYPFLKEYQKERIMVFFNPGRDPVKRGWNALQSELAVGSGGIAGKGFMQGTQHTLGFLPKTVSSTDFIFSVIAEETGFAGSMLVIFLYMALIASILRVAMLSCDEFGAFLAIGIAVMIFAHSFINISMTIRLMPVKGLPLPLISYGGSFMVCILFCLGILQSVYRISALKKDGLA